MKSFFFLIFFIIAIRSFSQSAIEKNQIYSSDGIEINLKKVDCIDKAKGIEKQILYFEMINSNNYPVNISFKRELWYNNICDACISNSSEYFINQNIQSSSSIQGGCTSKIPSLNIFVKMLNLDNVRQLTNYECKDIKIEKAN